MGLPAVLPSITAKKALQTNSLFALLGLPPPALREPEKGTRDAEFSSEIPLAIVL